MEATEGPAAGGSGGREGLDWKRTADPKAAWDIVVGFKRTGKADKAGSTEGRLRGCCVEKRSKTEPPGDKLKIWGVVVAAA